MSVTRIGFRAGYRRPALCSAIVLFSFGFRFAPAQCSQGTRLAAPSGSSAQSTQSSPPVSTTSESSSSSAITPQVRFATGSAVTVLEGTPLEVISDVPVSSRTTATGGKLSFTVTRDVVVDGILVIPCGARVFGTVLSAKQAGRLAGASSLTLELSELNLAGKSYPLYTPPFKVVGQCKTKPTMEKVTAGAAVGALAMDVRIATSNPTNLTRQPGPRAFSDGLAAGVGAGVGTAIAASSPPSIAQIPAESQLEFSLASPVAVYPVDQPTAARLAQGMHHGGPVLYIRAESQ